MPIWIMLAAAALQPAPAAGLPAFMLGDWGCYAYPMRRGGPTSTEEYWLMAGDRAMVGVGRVRQHQTRALEHMRISRNGAGRLTFYGSPGGAPPVAFVETQASPDAIVFENPQHDFPQRIAYRRDGDRLVATVSLLDGSGAQTWHFGRASTLRESGLEPRCNPTPARD